MDQTRDPSNIHVTFPNGEIKTYQRGIKLQEIAQDVQDRYPATIVAVKINNKIKELRNELKEDCDIEFIDLTTTDGMRIYQRSVSFLLVYAVKELMKDGNVMIHHLRARGSI